MLKLIVVLALVIPSLVIGRETLVKRCKRAAGACLLASEVTQGPYYWNSTVREDISEGRQGIPLRLSILVLDTRTCSPVPNAVVDLWHCDSAGIYSHFIAASLGQMGAPTDNSTFFRGQQVTNYQGVATFKTIYPGWYRGRATHMHIKVHIGASLKTIGGVIHSTGGHVSHTGQLYFEDNLSDAVGTIYPYSTQTVRRTRNNEDGIFGQSNGASMIVPIRFLTDEFTGGMAGEIAVGVDPSATPAPIGPGNGGGPRPPLPPPPSSR